MRFNPNILELVDASQLDADFGGELEYEFEKDSYWAQIVECVILISLLLRKARLSGSLGRVESRKMGPERVIRECRTPYTLYRT